MNKFSENDLRRSAVTSKIPFDWTQFGKIDTIIIYQYFKRNYNKDSIPQMYVCFLLY